MFAVVPVGRGRDTDISIRDKPHAWGEKKSFSLFKSSLFILTWEGAGFVWEKSQILWKKNPKFKAQVSPTASLD